MKRILSFAALALLACGCARKVGLVEFGVSGGVPSTKRGRISPLGGARIELACRTRRGIERHRVTCNAEGRASKELLSGRYIAVCRHPQWATQTYRFKVTGRRPQPAAFRMEVPGGGFRIRPQTPDGKRLAQGSYRVYDHSGRRMLRESFRLAKGSDSFAISGLPRGGRYSAAVFADGHLPGDRLDLAARAPGRIGTFGIRLRKAEYPPRRSGPARLEIVKGLPVLHVYGSGGEMGSQIGGLLGGRIRTLLRYEAEDLLPRRYLPFINKIARRDRPYIPERHRREMASIARAVGIGEHALVRAHVMVELLQMACTAIAVNGEGSADGKLLFGRNVDFPVTGTTVKSSLLVAYHSKKHKPFVSVGWPGLSGAVSGMNADGLCVANLLVMGRSLPRRGTPYLFLIRQALEECANVEEAIVLFRKAKRTVPHNIFLADQKTAAVLECTPGRVRVRRLKNGGPLLSSNSFAKRSARYCRRYREMSARAGRQLPLDVGEVQKLLDAVSLRRINIQSMVFIPAGRKLRISMGKAPASAGPFTEIDVGKLLKEK